MVNQENGNDSISEYRRGSEWRKWDFQIHTPASHLNNQFGNDWDAYVAGLFKAAIEKEISVLCITDYFTIDGYKKILSEYLEQPAKLKDLFSEEEIEKIHQIRVLPNVEFRLNKLVGQNRINSHVIFSEEVSPTDIEDHFLHVLRFTYQGEPQENAEKRPLRIVDLEELGTRLIGEHANFVGRTPIDVGMSNAVIDDDMIFETLQNNKKRFGGKYLFGVVADEDLSKIDWNSQDHHTRKVLIQKSDILFASNPNTKNWAIGMPPYTEGVDAFKNEFRTLKPCVHGSDAHSLIEIGHPCARRSDPDHSCQENIEECELRFCWIKADPTFEGLRQVLYESDSRIEIQESNPNPLKSTYTIKSFAISAGEITNGLSLKTDLLPLNGSLVAIAGGRGRGKTALVDLIANSFMGRGASQDPNSFVRRIANYDTTLTTELILASGEGFSKNVNDDTYCDSAEIVYIPQGELESHIAENSDLQKYVNDTIFESPQIKDSVLKHEYSSVYEEIENLHEVMNKVNGRITEFEDKTQPEIESEILKRRKLIEAELVDIAEKLKTLEGRRNAEQIKEAQDKQKALAELREKKENLGKIQILVRDARVFLADDLPSFNNIVFTLNKLLKAVGIKEEFLDLKYSQGENLGALNETVAQEASETARSIEKFQEELKAIAAETKRHTELLDKKSELEKRKNAAATELEELEKLKTRLAEGRVYRENQIKALLVQIFDLKSKYDEIIDKFSGEKAEILSDLDFTAEVKFDQDQFLSDATDLLDNRRIIVSPDEGSATQSPYLDILKEVEGMIVSNGVEHVDSYIGELRKLVETLPLLLKQSAGISRRDLYDHLFGDCFSVTPVVRYKSTDLDKLSMGQKATVLLKIYLAQDDRPIIIDSHDDHLDNEFIMEELVDAIRKAKNYRQVILVSNNGNVVVNSDAEQVIIVDRDDAGEISYSAGSIENPSIRKELLSVLEGGTDAFRRRQEKYRIGTR